MAEIYVNADELEQFARNLFQFAKSVEEIQQALRAGLANLSSTWRDQEYERFRDEFLKTERVINELLTEIRSVHPHLMEDVQFIRQYLQIQP